jgi:HAD superfamily hydrolase (TIGR01509 family)
MFKNLVFDFDGTIVNSIETVYKSLILSLNIKAPSFQELRKYPSDKLFSSFFTTEISRLQLPQLMFQARSEYKKQLKNLDPIEGIRDTLLNLHSSGARLFLCTSNSTENVNEFLKIHKIDHTFETVVGTLSLFGKSYGIKKTLKEFKLSPHETIYIGDETRDIQAAKKAGICCASVSWGFHERSLLEEYKPDFIFDTAYQLLTLLD